MDNKMTLSKVLRMGGQRLFNVGLAVILGVGLGLATDATMAAPAEARENYAGQMFHRVGCPNPGPLRPCRLLYARDANTGVVYPYMKTYITWNLRLPQRCPQPLHQTLSLQIGNPYGPERVLWERNSYYPPTEIVHGMPIGRRYRYRVTATCPSEPADGFLSPEGFGPEWALNLKENDTAGISYHTGYWYKVTGPEYSGGSTHYALHANSRASYDLVGFAAALVTTLNPLESPYGYDWLTIICGRSPGEICDSYPTATAGSSAVFREIRPLGNLSRFGSYDFSQQHSATINVSRVNSRDTRRADIDAFVVAVSCEIPTTARCL
jgi:hypothetical protein